MERDGESRSEPCLNSSHLASSGLRSVLQVVMNEVTSLRTLTDQRLHSAYPQTLEPALLTSIKHTADTRASRSCSLHCKLRAIHLTSIHVCHRRHFHCMTSLMATLSAFSLALARCGRCQVEPLRMGNVNGSRTLCAFLCNPRF